MNVAVWIALGFLVAAGAAGTAFAIVRALAFWRAFRRLRREAAAALEQVAGAAARVEERLAALESRAAEAAERVERLQTTLAQAGVLAAALRDVGDVVGRLRAGIPRK